MSLTYNFPIENLYKKVDCNRALANLSPDSFFSLQVYTAERQISIFYEEASKDCRPRFESPLYQMELDANLTLSSSPKIVGQVAAASCGSEADIQVDFVNL